MAETGHPIRSIIWEAANAAILGRRRRNPQSGPRAAAFQPQNASVIQSYAPVGIEFAQVSPRPSESTQACLPLRAAIALSPEKPRSAA